MGLDLFWIVIAAFAVWFLFIRSRPESAPELNAVGESVARPDSEPESTELAQIQAAISARNEEEEKWWSESEARRKESEPFKSKIWKAGKIIQETGVADALPFIWEQLNDSLLSEENKENDLARFVGLATEKSSEGPSAVSWRWDDAVYRLECEEPYSHPTLRLFVDGEAVIGINCSIVSNWPMSYEYLSVERLKVGPWMEEIARMGGILRRAQSAAWDALHDDSARDAAALIDLGEGEQKNQTTTDKAP